MSTATRTRTPVTIRRATPDDVPASARICYEAFRTINERHAFPPDLPSAEVAAGLMKGLFSHPGFVCYVAEADGQIVGSNCLDERSLIHGVGPITIDPSQQNKGVGRKLMEAVLERARERQAPGVRLVQAAFHGRSMSLYASMGFVVREPLVVMQGAPLSAQIHGCTVRGATTEDLDACNNVCYQVHGFHRGGELKDAISHGNAKVVERSGRLTGYATGLAFFAHAVGESTVDIQALIASAEAFGGPGIIVPLRNAALFRWCLEHRLRVVEPLTLMTMGLYNEPAGAYLPSILY